MIFHYMGNQLQLKKSTSVNLNIKKELLKEAWGSHRNDEKTGKQGLGIPKVMRQSQDQPVMATQDLRCCHSWLWMLSVHVTSF